MPVMTQEWQDQNQANMNRWLLGNKDAVNFINMLFDAVELWDDLIDKDNEISDDFINRGFAELMFGLPASDWFAAHRTFYVPLLLTSINGFLDANEMCKSDQPHHRNLAFHIRNFGIEVILATVFLVGGFGQLREVSREVREFFAFESFEEWEYRHA